MIAAVGSDTSRWVETTLGSICEIQLGKMLSPKSKTGTGTAPYLRNANVQWDRFDLDDLASMDFDEREREKFGLRPGDLLVCEGGEPGRSAVWEGQIEPCFYQKALHRLRPKYGSVEPRFLMFRLWLGALQSEFVDAHAKTTIAHLPAVRLSSLPLRLPPIAVQRRILETLSGQFRLAKTARSAAEARLEAAKNLIELNRETVLADATLHGARVLLSEICSIEARQVDPREVEFGRLPHVSGENIESGTGRLLEIRSAAEDGMISGKYLFETGDVLYSKLRPYLRKVTVAEFAGVCSADMYPLRTVTDRIDPVFLANVLLGREFTSYAETESGRARMPKLNRQQLLKWEISLPSLAVQRQAVMKLEELAAMSEQVQEAAGAELRALAALPSALLRRAFAGEL